MGGTSLEERILKDQKRNEENSERSEIGDDQRLAPQKKNGNKMWKGFAGLCILMLNPTTRIFSYF